MVQAAQRDDGCEARPKLKPLELALLNDFQRGFPLDPQPFARIAEALGVGEEEVLSVYRDLMDRGLIKRIGPVVRPHRLGWSTLATMSVPQERLAEVAELVTSYGEVNHNYEREHAFNLWFVVTAPSRQDVMEVLADIASRSGLQVLDLPLEQPYRVDLGFPIS
jgi:DNA-binding Lrp family transcriptional regulator